RRGPRSPAGSSLTRIPRRSWSSWPITSGGSARRTPGWSCSGGQGRARGKRRWSTRRRRRPSGRWRRPPGGGRPSLRPVGRSPSSRRWTASPARPWSSWASPIPAATRTLPMSFSPWRPSGRPGRRAQGFGKRRLKPSSEQEGASMDRENVQAFSPDRYDRMIYRRAGRSGLLLPAISLGAWETFGGYRGEDVARACLFRAFDLGITHFDLANNYGQPPGNAERVVGRILREMPRDELIISTKAGFRMWPGPYGDGLSKKYLVASLDQSLK